MIAQRKKITVSSRKKEISRCLFAAINSPIALTASGLPILTTDDYPIVMRSALDILRLLQGKDVVRIVTVLGLWNMQPYLEKISTNGERSTKIQALTLLGYFTDNTSLKTLLSHVADKDTYVQIAALHSLAKRNAIDYMQHIVDGVIDSHKTNAMMLADILERFGEPAVPWIIQLISITSHLEVKIAGIIALGDIGSFQSVDTLIALMDNTNTDIGANAIIALGKIGDERAAGAIAHHLNSPHSTIRVQAAKTLGILQVLSSLPQLVEKLNDEDWWVRFYAAEAIYHFGDKGIAALKAISTQHNNAGIIAQQMLGEHAGGL